MPNIKMWGNALRVIPRIEKAEWDRLDVFARWLIATRAAVFVMTALAAAIGGLLAYRNGSFSWSLLILSLLGIVLAHATNNLLNDLVDYNKGIDKNNYYRSQYGPQPLEHKLLSKTQFMSYLIVTGLLATAIGVYLTIVTGTGTLLFFGAGLFFLLFYTWPLKYYGMGEPSVILVWGPLMIGGTYFVISGGNWDNWIIPLSLIYALGPTTVLFGKHTDKLKEDKAKGVRTLPVVIGEKAARYSTIAMWILQYAFVVLLVITKQFTPAVLLVFLAVPKLIPVIKIFMQKRPETKPEGKAGEGWPLYLVSNAFIYNRAFGLWFLLGLILDVVLVKTGVL